METNLKKAALLVVDDDPAILRLLEKVIASSFSEQFNVETCLDAVEARKKIEQWGIDILLTDLEMPGVSGLDLLRSAKNRNAHCQVLLLTGHSSHQALLEAMELGASDYLLKPFEQAELLDLLGQAYSRLQRWKMALLATWKQQKQKVAAEG